MELKVAYLLGRFPVRTEYAVLQEISALIQLEVEPTIIAFHACNHPLPRELAHLQAHVTYLDPASTLLRIVCRVADSGRRRARLDQALQQLQPDIIHAQFGHLGFAAVAPARERGLRLALSFRGQDVLLVRNAPEPDRRRLFDCAAGILVRCETMKNDLIEMGAPPKKTFIVPSGIDLEKLPFCERTPPAPGAPVRALFAGRDVPKKGKADAERAIAALRHEHAVTLHIAHDLPHDEVIAAMMRAHLLLLPSRTAPDGEKEGIPNVIKEAMATGLPVVSTRHAGIPECVEHERSGLLSTEGDARGLQQNLQWMITHPEHWPAMGRRGRAIVAERYDVRALAPRVLEHYHEIIARCN